MRFGFYTLFFYLLIFAPLLTQTECDQLIRSNFIRGNTQFVSSVERDLVVRGDYTYKVEILSDARGIMLKMVSVDGMLLQRGDELILIDQSGHRESLVFSERGAVNNVNNIPVSSNFVQLSIELLEWLSGTRIPHFFLKKSHENIMRKISVHSSRAGEFQQMAQCMKSVLDIDYIPILRSNEAIVAGATGEQAGPNNSAKTASKSVATNDPEIRQSQDELARTRERLRREIEMEYQRAEEIKEQIREQLMMARQNKDQRLREFELEIAEEREKTTNELLRLRAERLERISAERHLTRHISDSLRGNILTEIRKAEEVILMTRKKSADEIDRSRKEAQEAVAAIRERLDNEKRMYADQVADTRNAAAVRINEINEELSARIAEARNSVSVQQELGVEEVVAARKNAADQVIKARVTAAEAVASAKLEATLAKESIARDVIEARRRAAEEKALASENHQNELLHLREMQTRQKEEIAMEIEEIRASRVAMTARNQSEMANAMEVHRARLKAVREEQEMELAESRESHFNRLAETRLQSDMRIAELSESRQKIVAERDSEIIMLRQKTDSMVQSRLEEQQRIRSAFVIWHNNHTKLRDSVRAESVAALELEKRRFEDKQRELIAQWEEIERRKEVLESEFTKEEKAIRDEHLKRINEINSKVANRLKEVEKAEAEQLAGILKDFEIERKTSQEEGKEYRLKLAEEVRDTRIRALEEITSIRQRLAEEKSSLDREEQETRLKAQSELAELKQNHHLLLQEERDRTAVIRRQMTDERQAFMEDSRAELTELREKFLNERMRWANELHNYKMSMSDSLKRAEREYGLELAGIRANHLSVIDSLKRLFQYQREVRNEVLQKEAVAFDEKLAILRMQRHQNVDSLRRAHGQEVQSLLNEQILVREDLLKEIQNARALANEKVEQVQREEVLRIHEAKKMADREIETIKKQTAEAAADLRAQINSLQAEVDSLKAEKEKMTAGERVADQEQKHE